MPYESKTFKPTDIVERAQHTQAGHADVLVEVFKNFDQFEQLNETYVLTRWTTIGSKEYCVFEMAF